VEKNQAKGSGWGQLPLFSVRHVARLCVLREMEGCEIIENAEESHSEERNGIQEVESSILFGSTLFFAYLTHFSLGNFGTDGCCGGC
jgi:hypothetical protein